MRQGEKLQNTVKKLYWHTTFGQIGILEHCFLEAGRLIRPFCHWADVSARGYSQPLQRRITDFGADVPFGKISEVIGTIEPHVEPDSVPKEQAPVRTCYRYMLNRRGQFNYKEAF